MINLEKYYKEHVSKEDYYKFYNELITKAEEDKKSNGRNQLDNQ